MTTAMQIVAAAIPNATERDVDYVLWERTPYPCGAVTARELYRAASAMRRAKANGIHLCTFCHRPRAEGEWECQGHHDALARTIA